MVLRHIGNTELETAETRGEVVDLVIRVRSDTRITTVGVDGDAVPVGMVVLRREVVVAIKT